MTDLDLSKIKEAAEKAANLPDDAIIEVSVLRIREHFSISLELAGILKESIAALEAAEARNATAYAEGVEAAAKAVEAYKRDASFDDSQVGALEHNSNEENIVCAIRSLLKDKPNEKTRQIAPPGQSTGE